MKLLTVDLTRFIKDQSHDCDFINCHGTIKVINHLCNDHPTLVNANTISFHDSECFDRYIKNEGIYPKTELAWRIAEQIGCDPGQDLQQKLLVLNKFGDLDIPGKIFEIHNELGVFVEKTMNRLQYLDKAKAVDISINSMDQVVQFLEQNLPGFTFQMNKTKDVVIKNKF